MWIIVHADYRAAAVFEAPSADPGPWGAAPARLTLQLLQYRFRHEFIGLRGSCVAIILGKLMGSDLALQYVYGKIM